MPDPRDRHPDHCTTAVFVLSALRQLRQEDPHQFAGTRVLTYLVHSPDYPASPTWVNGLAGAGVGGSGAAGDVLAGTAWVSLPLSSVEFSNKQVAVSDYRSQMQVMNSFLAQFLRSVELFAELTGPQVMVVPQEYAARFGHRR